MFVASDYLGYNSNSTLPHPYAFYPEQILRTAISALNIVQPVITISYLQDNLSLFTAGYSEGAAYSLWFSKCLDKESGSKCSWLSDLTLHKFYHLQKSAGLEGAYDLKLQFRFLQDNVTTEDYNEYRILDVYETNFGKPRQAAFSIISYLKYTKGTGVFQPYFSTDFYNMAQSINYKCPCIINAKNNVIY